MPNLPAKPLAVYIHWPFCRKKCPYCDFNSHVRDTIDHAAWREALLKELEHWKKTTTDHTVTSIFFGGGTPSLMQPSTVEALINDVSKHWQVSPTLEVTLEANPTSVEAGKFHDMRAAGVNRVSLGVQSLRAEQLTFLGREHSANEALDAVSLARGIFPRYSFDMIYALPNQSLADWERELREALPHVGAHMSLYQLTIEENTAFHHAYHNLRDFTLPGEALAADLYQLTQDIMEAESMPAYEISNHARAGEESLHNLSYWKSHAYLGIGPGAHGRVDANGERYATRCLKSPERWLDQALRLGHGLEEETLLTADERLEEKILMGLRLRDGIALGPADRAQLPAIEKLQHEGLLENTGRLQATARGRLLLNHVTARLLS